MTTETQQRYLNGPERSGLPGYVVIEGGIWTVTEDGREWRHVEQREDEFK